MSENNNLSIGMDAFEDTSIAKAFSNDLEKGGKPVKKSGEPMTITDRRSGKQITGMWRTMGGNKVFVSGDGKVQVGSDHVKEYVEGKGGSGDSKDITKMSPSAQRAESKRIGDAAKASTDASKKRMADSTTKFEKETGQSSAANDAAFSRLAGTLKANKTNDPKGVLDGLKSKGDYKSLPKNLKDQVDEYAESLADSGLSKEDRIKKYEARQEAKKDSGKKLSTEKLSTMVDNAVRDRDMQGTFKVTDMSAGGREDYNIDPAGFTDAKYDGMDISYSDGVYTVEEKQAGKDEEAIFSYGDFKTLGAAMNQFAKGNHVDGGTKPKKVWDMSSDGASGTTSFEEYQKKGSPEAKIKAAKKSQSPEEKKRVESNRKAVEAKDKEAGKKYDKNAAPIREGDRNAAKFKEATAYKNIGRQDKKTVESINNFGRLDQDNFTKEEKDQVESIFEDVSDGLLSISKYDSNADDSPSEKVAQDKVNAWVDKHNKSGKEKRITPEGLQDAVGNGVFDQYFSEHFSAEITDTFNKLNDKYSKSSDPDQLNLFKSIQGIFDILGV